MRALEAKKPLKILSTILGIFMIGISIMKFAYIDKTNFTTITFDIFLNCIMIGFGSSFIVGKSPLD